MSSNTSKIKNRDAHIPPALRRRLEKLQHIGHDGGIISPHRSMLTLPMHPGRFMPALLIALLLFAILIINLAWLDAFWAWLLQFMLGVFEMDNEIGAFGFNIGEWVFQVPYLLISAGAPTGEEWITGIILVVVVLLISFVLPDALLPIAYLLRALAFIQSYALVFFAFFPDSFPYNLAGYHAVMMLAGLVFMLLVPLVFGFIYYIFDLDLSKKLGLTVCTLVHLWLFIPIHYFAHVLIIHKYSLLYLPTLFLMFGLMLEVFILIAFYSWGMSWQGSLYEEEPLHSLNQ
ncbi:MAG: hypothetical protein ACU85E_14690 [Gammaproteobacteria bacterium]